MNLYQSIITSPLGDLIAVASDRHLMMLEFADSGELGEKLDQFSGTKLDTNDLLKKTEKEL